jgi:segregation and condensation protein B
MPDEEQLEPTPEERLLARVLEGLLFATPKPMSAKEIRAALQGAKEDADEENQLEALTLATYSEKKISEALVALADEYNVQNRAFMLKDTASGWHLVTRPDYGLWVRQLFPELKPTRLTAPALETLAITAYRQPLTRADMEAIRGVSVDGALQTLLDRGLVKIAGRAESPGRPLLYETTIHFLEHFGLRSLMELPNAGELGRVMNQAAETGKAAAAATQGSRQENKPVIADVPVINSKNPGVATAEEQPPPGEE